MCFWFPHQTDWLWKWFLVVYWILGLKATARPLPGDNVRGMSLGKYKWAVYVSKFNSHLLPPFHPCCLLLTASFSLFRLQGSVIKQSASGWLGNHWQLQQLQSCWSSRVSDTNEWGRERSWKRRIDRLQNRGDWVSPYLALPNSRICVSMESELGSDKVEFYSWEMLSVSSCKNGISNSSLSFPGLWCRLVELELFRHSLLCL